MRKILAVCFLALTAACGPAEHTAPAPTPAEQSGALEIRDAWAAPTPGGVDVAAGYLTIANGTGAEDRLLSASSPRAGRVELHEMSMDGAVMRMRAVEALPVEAGGEVQLAPGGRHLMFMQLTAPFTPGEEIPVQLTFEHAGAVAVTLPVRTAPAAEHGAHETP